MTCAVGGNGAWREELMGLSAQAGREFWRGVLVADGFTAIPRWSLEQATGVAEHEATVPDDLAAALAAIVMPQIPLAAAAETKAERDARMAWWRVPAAGSRASRAGRRR